MDQTRFVINSGIWTIVVPFDQHPCSGGHILPFVTGEKPNFEDHRVIVDLSWPFGQSVSAGIDKTSYLETNFLLTLPTVDHITDFITILGLSWRHVYIDLHSFWDKTWFAKFFCVCYIMRENGYKIVGYLNDYVEFDVPSEARDSFDFFYK